EARRLFDEADEAIRRARQQQLDWSMHRERVLELILQLAAQAAGAGEQSSSARDDRLFHVARKILAERAGMAHDLIAGLEQSLRGSLDGLRRAEPLADDIIASRADRKPAGLPVPDLTALHARTSRLRPWWAPALPPLADRVARRRLETSSGRRSARVSIPTIASSRPGPGRRSSDSWNSTSWKPRPFVNRSAEPRPTRIVPRRIMTGNT
ncbi:MAG: hypothetical protein WBX00_34440, partial [Isosphaeraceae bacterium]